MTTATPFNSDPSPDTFFTVPRGVMLPAYWNRHSFGDGDSKPGPELHTVDVAGARIALGALRKYQQSLLSMPPLALRSPFRHGDEFAAEAFQPGSIFWMNREYLVADAPVTPNADYGIVDGEQTEAVPSIPYNTAGTMLARHQQEKWTYVTVGGLAVTIKTKRGDTELLAPTIPRIIVTRAGPAVVNNSYVALPTEFALGDVAHLRTRDGGEVLTRFNRVYHCSEGSGGDGQTRPAWWRYLMDALAGGRMPTVKPA